MEPTKFCNVLLYSIARLSLSTSIPYAAVQDIENVEGLDAFTMQYQIALDQNTKDDSTNKSSQTIISIDPPAGQAIGFGFLSTTIVILSALTGFVFSPLQKYKIYPVIVSFMVAASAGSLFSGVLISLQPEALRLAAFQTSSYVEEELWFFSVSVATCGGSFLFFVLEFVLTRLRLTLEKRSRKRSRSLSVHSSVAKRLAASGKEYTRAKSVSSPNCANGTETCVVYCASKSVKPFKRPSFSSSYTKYTANKRTDSKMSLHGRTPFSRKFPQFTRGRRRRPSIYDEITPTVTLETTRLCVKLVSLEPVVWMLVIGNGVHCFMDGLSIGVSFTRSIKLGIGLTVSVLCDGLLHEVADLAVLLRAGISVPLAVLFSVCTSCVAYLGFFVGVVLRSLPSAATYIFAVTAGFFLHLSLANMIAEMRKTEKTLKNDDRQMVILFLVHCTGLLFGFGCNVLVTISVGFIVI